MRHEGSVTFSALVLLVGAGALALSILQTTFGGMQFGGDFSLKWSSDQGVLLAEMAIAGLAILVAVLLTIRIYIESESIGHIAGWLGLGIFALGALSIAAAWAGLRVPTPVGVDGLERGEWRYVITGAAAIFVGLVTIVIAAAVGEQPPESQNLH